MICIEKSLRVGDKRFGLLDEIKLSLSTGSVVKGRIVVIEDWGVGIEDYTGKVSYVHTNDILEVEWWDD